MDRGAWWATAHGVTKGWMGLSDYLALLGAGYFCNLISFLELCSRLLLGYLETI